MKKTFYLLPLLVLLFSVRSFAQSRLPLDTIDVVKKRKPTPYQENHLTYGFTVGGGYSGLIHAYNLSFGDENFRQKRLLGGTVGVFVDKPLNPFVHVQPELDYALTGYIALADLQEFRRYYNRINLPVYFKFYPGHYLHFYVGPQVGYMFKVFDINFNPDPTLIQKYERGNGNLRGLLFSWNIGAGVDLNKRLAVNMIYSLDFTNSYKVLGLDEPNFRNQAFSIRLAYRLNLKNWK